MQLALPLATTEQHASHEDVGALMEWLRGRGWVKAKQIEQVFTTWSERHIRAIASDSQGRILSSTHGYKLTIEATADELRAGTAPWRSQVKTMTQRIIDTEHVWHDAPHRKGCLS